MDFAATFLPRRKGCCRITAILTATLMPSALGVAAPVNPVVSVGGDQGDEQNLVPFPRPRFKVDLEKDVRMQMTDGVGLYADIYRPRGAGKHLPTILIRTQYGKDSYRDGRDSQTATGVPYMFAGQGFVVAVQDLRGRFHSEGTFHLAKSDVDDGYDTVNWIASQPWSNGKVGGYGCSSLGIAQVMMSQRRPAALAAIVPQGAGGALRNNPYDVRFSGVPMVGWELPWFREDTNQRPQVLKKIDYSQVVRTLPVADMADRAGGAPNDWREWVTREPGDRWWHQFRFFDENSRPDVPGLFIGSWHDTAEEALELFNRFRTQSVSLRARRNQYVIISPTKHCQSERAMTPYIAGERDVGDVRKDYWPIYLGWYDHWLRNGNSHSTMPHVQYYLMGANRWKSADNWPVPGTRFVAYYLSSGGHANTSSGDGELSTAPASGPADRYRYDPLDPTPSPTRAIDMTASDQRSLDLRPDRLVFTTQALRSGMEVTGSVRAVLYVSSSALDTDFFVQLSDVYPDGRVYNLVNGIARARYRSAYTAPTRAAENYQNPTLLVPGKTYQIEIKMGATSNWFPPGHRIRVEVASASFPLYERNLNTGGNNATETASIIAQNTIYHDRDRPSHVILPVVR